MFPVEKKETAYSISREYNVPLNALYSANPGIERGLKEGQRVRIPVQAVKNERIQNLIPANDYITADTLFGTYYNPTDSLINHVVKPKETMYALCRYYKVHADSVLNVNNGLPMGLLFGDTIRIPKRNPLYKKSAQDPYSYLSDNQNNKDSSGILSDSYEGLFTFNENIRSRAGLKEVYKVALMLPLNINDYLTADKDGNYLPIESNFALEFYQGAMLAIDSLKAMGLSVDVYVYDTKKDKEAVKKYLFQPEFKDMDLIIGPMYRSVFNVVKSFAHDHQIKIVCPVPHDNDVLLNTPEVFKAVCSETTQMRYMAKYLLSKKPSAKIFAINSLNPKDFDQVNSFVNTYNGVAPQAGRDTVATLTMGEYDIDEIAAALVEDQENILVVPSSDVSFVTSLINRLTTIENINDLQVSIYGQEKWLKFDKIDASYKNRFNIHLSSSYFLDYNNADLISFYKKYRNEYKTDPGKFCIQGFDISYFFLKALFRYGTHFNHYTDQLNSEGLIFDFRLFRAFETNGFENIHVYLLKYENFELKQVN